MKNNFIRIVLGMIIFLFGTALAYFTANYMDTSQGPNYWLTLAIFGAAYVLVGVVTSMLFPVSLGFLFSADVIILHVLFDQYGKIDEIYKALLVAFILFILYVFTWLKLGDTPLVRQVVQAPPEQNHFPVS